MEPFVKIIDNFYEHPEQIREHAMKQKYQKFTSSNYAGNDSIDRNIINDECKNKIQNVLGPDLKFTQARYRYAREKDHSIGFVHSDFNPDHKGKGYHVLIYLTPDELKGYDDSVGFYEHETFGIIPSDNFVKKVFKKDSFNLKKFNEYKTIKYKFNRAVILDYNYFHAPGRTHGFGEDLTNCRILQIIEVFQQHI